MKSILSLAIDMDVRGKEHFYTSGMLIGLTLVLSFSQTGNCECIYEFDGVQNGITFGVNVDNTDQVFKFTIVNQTGHIMSNKHTTMITEYSTYYHVVNDYLKLRICPYPGLKENIEFGIEDEISCNVTITVTATPAITELPIPGEVSVWINGQTQESEIIVYQLQLNATEECASYQCDIDCRNDKSQYFRATAGTTEAYKSLFYVYTTPWSIKYSPFVYELLFACNDMVFTGSTLVTEKVNFTFYDSSVTSKLDTSTLPLSHIPESKPQTPLTSTGLKTRQTETTFQTKRQSTTLSVLASLAVSVRETPVLTEIVMTTNTNRSTSSFITVTDNSLSHKSSTKGSITSMYLTDIQIVSGKTSSKVSIKHETPISKQFITTKNQHYSPDRMSTIYSEETATEELRTDSFSQRDLKVTGLFTVDDSFGSFYTTSSSAENTTTNSGSFFDEPANVAAISAVAGVAAVGAVGAGTYALASQRCDIRGDKTKRSEDTKGTDAAEDGVKAQHEVLPTNKPLGQNKV